MFAPYIKSNNNLRYLFNISDLDGFVNGWKGSKHDEKKALRGEKCIRKRKLEKKEKILEKYE